MEKSLQRIQNGQRNAMYTSQQSVENKVGGIPGWQALLTAVGFRLDPPASGLPAAVFFPTSDPGDRLQQCSSAVQSLLGEPGRGCGGWRGGSQGSKPGGDPKQQDASPARPPRAHGRAWEDGSWLRIYSAALDLPQLLGHTRGSGGRPRPVTPLEDWPFSGILVSFFKLETHMPRMGNVSGSWPGEAAGLWVRGPLWVTPAFFSV